MRSLIMVLVASAIVFVACDPKKTEANVSEPLQNDSLSAAAGGTQIGIDKTATKIKWTGRKGVAGAKLGSHYGTISLGEGSVLTMKDNKLTSGKFTFDMKTIAVNDLKPEEGKEKLETHLKSKDFFKADSFPKGEFELVEVSGADSAATIKGNLTLLGVTKGVSFPAKITYNDGGKAVKANAKFEIDRTDWNIVYGNDKSLKDKFIHPKIEIELELVSAQ